MPVVTFEEILQKELENPEFAQGFEKVKKELKAELVSFNSVPTSHSMSDEELVELMLAKMEGKNLDFNNPDHVAEFFDETLDD